MNFFYFSSTNNSIVFFKDQELYYYGLKSKLKDQSDEISSNFRAYEISQST